MSMVRESGVDDAYPLTPMQEGMLFHSLEMPHDDPYIVQLSCSLEDLDPDRWRAAWRLVINRHPALRSCFAWKSQRKPLQIVAKDPTPSWQQLDFRGLDAAEFEARRLTFFTEDRRAGYDLARAPLLRFALAALDGNQTCFLWSFHHILLDAWSGARVLGEVVETYGELATRPALRLPAGPPFRRYIEWLERQDRAQAERFWRKALAGIRGPTPLGIGRWSPERGARSFQTLDLAVSPAESARVLARARSEKVTVNTLVQAAWAALLARYSGREDVLFGSTVAGRPTDLPALEETVGLFINTIPTRVHVSQQAPIGAWMRDLQRAQLDARVYEYAALSDIHGWSEIPRDEPLFESVLIFENLPAALALNRSGGALALRDAKAQWFTSFPLSIMVVPAQPIRFSVAYDCVRFDRADIERLLRTLAAFVVRALDSPERSLADLAFVDPEDLLPCQLSGPRRAVPELLVHEQAARIAAQTPGRVGLYWRGGAHTFGELHERADALAATLAAHGARPGSCVALATARNPALVVGMLGILKSGAAFVYIDPALPRARRERLERECGIELRVEDAAGERTASPQTIELSPDGRLSLTASGVARPLRAGPDDPAYVVYTSGSSGQPKGICIPHRALANALASLADRPGLTANKRVLALTTASFDIALAELLMPLVVGAVIDLVPSSEVLDATALAARIGATGANWVQATPSTWRMLLDLAEPDLHGVRVLCGGERLERGLADRLLAKGAEVWNVYGPSECTIWSSAARITHGSSPVSIGRPIANTEFRVVNARLEAVPAGVAGELLIAGAGLALGYVDAAMDADRFVDLGDGAGHRFYRTGDLTRIEADGSLVFLGRCDDQVKIRGHRIEPAEIEIALSRHPQVRAAGVAALPDGSGTLALVVGVVAAEVSDRELSTYLAAELPEALIPNRFVRLPALPLSPNGKLDRRALHASLAALGVEPGPPMRSGSPIEQLVASIVAAVLARTSFELHDDFFMLGGHSLLVVQATARLSSAFKVSLPIRFIFEHRSVAAMARALETLLRAGTGESPQFRKSSGDGPFPLSPAQRRLWFHRMLEGVSAPYTIVSAVVFRGDLDLERLESALQRLIERHEALRLEFRTSTGEVLQHLVSVGTPHLQPIDARSLKASDLMRAVRTESRHPFERSRAPLLKLRIWRTKESEWLLALIVDHIVCDGWSLGILLEELFEIYVALQENRRPELPEPAARFADCCLADHQRLQTPRDLPDLEYWRDRLRNVQPTELPGARTRPSAPSFDGGNVLLELAAPLVAAMSSLSRQEAATPFVILLAAFKALLHRVSGETDLVCGTIVSGRTHETERVVGMFASPLVLRSRISGDLSFRNVVREEQSGFLEAWRHDGVPFERIVEALVGERDPARHPLYQVLFVMQNLPGRTVAESDATRPFLLPPDSVECDLVIQVYPRDPGMLVRFGYARDLYEQTAIERLARQYRRLLEQVVQDVTLPISALSLTLDDENEKLVTWFNDQIG